MEISAQLTYDRILAGSDKQAHLVVSLKAPPLRDASQRAKVCIVLCIDVSGSMGGPKLSFAKESALKVIEHLREGDRCGLVTFDEHVRVHAPPTLITPASKTNLQRLVNQLSVGGSTNFAGGMLESLNLMNRADLPGDVLHRLVMLTDGHANIGLAKTPEEILRVFESNRGRVTASAFGFGLDVSQDFLSALAQKGEGNYAFISQPAEALEAFGREVGGLLSTYATNISIQVTPLGNHQTLQVVSDVPSEEEEIGNVTTVRLSDILAEETRHVVLAVKIAGQNTIPRAS